MERLSAAGRLTFSSSGTSPRREFWLGPVTPRYRFFFSPADLSIRFLLPYAVSRKFRLDHPPSRAGTVDSPLPCLLRLGSVLRHRTLVMAVRRRLP